MVAEDGTQLRLRLGLITGSNLAIGGLDLFPAITITLKRDQQLKRLEFNLKHAVERLSFDAIKAFSSVCGRASRGYELIDDQIHVASDLFGVASLSGFDVFHGGGLVDFVKRIKSTRIKVGRPLFVYTNSISKPAERQLHPYELLQKPRHAARRSAA